MHTLEEDVKVGSVRENMPHNSRCLAAFAFANLKSSSVALLLTDAFSGSSVEHPRDERFPHVVADHVVDEREGASECVDEAILSIRRSNGQSQL
jgi:hypothetical protein